MKILLMILLPLVSFGQKHIISQGNTITKEQQEKLEIVLKKYKKIHGLDHESIIVKNKPMASTYNSREVIRILAQVDLKEKNTVVFNSNYKDFPDFLLISVFTHELFHTFKSKQDTVINLFKTPIHLVEARDQNVYATGYQGFHLIGTLEGEQIKLTDIIEEGFAELFSLYIDPVNFSNSHRYLEAANMLKIFIKKGLLSTKDIVHIKKEGNLQTLVSKIINTEATDEQVYEFGKLFVLMETGAINVSQQYKYINDFIQENRK